MNHSIYTAALESFVQQGYLSKSYLDSSTFDHEDSRAQLNSLLLQGRIPEMVFAQTLSRLYGLPLATEVSFPDTPLIGTLPLADFFKQNEVLPLAMKANCLELAMVDPSNEFVLRVISSKLACEIQPVIAVRNELLVGLKQLYDDKSHVGASVGAALAANVDDGPEDIESESTLIQEIHRVLQRGITIGASDIHFEPEQHGLRVRYRVAGVMQQAHSFDPEDALPASARIKLMAKLDVTQRRLPQDGRFKFRANGQLFDLRVSTMPLHSGESIVIRLLDPSLGSLSLGELGYRPSVALALQQAVTSQQGLVLVTGPTGSGKSTTLYSLLNMLNRPEIKVISIENPVEIVLNGVNQIQIDEAHGVSFASALKSVLRQDPDIIMVGEIRDAETARLSAQAALTGHLVLSTLHTSSSCTAVTRLRDLGIPDYLISATLETVVAQRLVRVNCADCQTDNRSVSCRSCYGSGYSGRTAVAELLECVQDVDLSLSSAALELALGAKLLDQMTLRDDALRLLEKGVIDQAEMMRSLGMYANSVATNDSPSTQN
jgi:general secretion pathway protein E